jgi:hypothetical protein
MSCGALEGREGKGAGGMRGDGHAGARACMLGAAAGTVSVPCRLHASCQSDLGACWNDDLAVGDALLQHASSKQHLRVGWKGDGAGGLCSTRRERGTHGGQRQQSDCQRQESGDVQAALGGCLRIFWVPTTGTGPPQVAGSFQFLRPCCWKGQPLRCSCKMQDDKETSAGQNQHRKQPVTRPPGQCLQAYGHLFEAFQKHGAKGRGDLHCRWLETWLGRQWAGRWVLGRSHGQCCWPALQHR